jgi:hypothetical protein
VKVGPNMPLLSTWGRDGPSLLKCYRNGSWPSSSPSPQRRRRSSDVSQVAGRIRHFVQQCMVALVDVASSCSRGDVCRCSQRAGENIELAAAWLVIPDLIAQVVFLVLKSSVFLAYACRPSEMILREPRTAIIYIY